MKRNSTVILLDSKGALKALGLWIPESGKKPNHHYIGRLVEQERLPRIQLGPRTFRYELDDCIKLRDEAAMLGLRLT